MMILLSDTIQISVVYTSLKAIILSLNKQNWCSGKEGAELNEVGVKIFINVLL